MEYSFQNMKLKNGMSIGAWKKMDVYSISKYDYFYRVGRNAIDKNSIYVIYDDGNVMIHNGDAIGILAEDGTVEDISLKDWRNYKPEAAKQLPQPFSSFGISVDDILAEACDCSWIDKYFAVG